MKRVFSRLREALLRPSIAIVGLVAGSARAAAGGDPSNPHILPQGRAVLDYLRRLPDAPQRAILSGQWVSGPAAWPMAYRLFVQNLHEATGKWIAILGSDYDPSHKPAAGAAAALASPPKAAAEQDRALTTLLIDHWKAGGLVSLTWFADNPWRRLGAGESCGAVPEPCVDGPLSDLTRTDTPAGAYFKAELDALAENLETLQKAGVIVLFRPFHEMNGSWFWWGVRSPDAPSQAEFAALWRYVYDYLTDVKKLDNLLWVFSPANSENRLALYPKWHGIIQPAPYYYPGDRYADVVGLDVYLDRVATIPGANRNTSVPAYEQLAALAKPLGLAELGPATPEKGDFDFDGVLHQIADAYPKIGFFCAWQDNPAKRKRFSIVTNPSPTKLMTDPMIVTREAVRY